MDGSAVIVRIEEWVSYMGESCCTYAGPEDICRLRVLGCLRMLLSGVRARLELGRSDNDADCRKGEVDEDARPTDDGGAGKRANEGSDDDASGRSQFI